jgi:hypothetical protein
MRISQQSRTERKAAMLFVVMCHEFRAAYMDDASIRIAIARAHRKAGRISRAAENLSAAAISRAEASDWQASAVNAYQF